MISIGEFNRKMQLGTDEIQGKSFIISSNLDVLGIDSIKVSKLENKPINLICNNVSKKNCEHRQ